MALAFGGSSPPSPVLINVVLYVFLSINILIMARKSNIRNLRSTLWSNMLFSMYCAKSQSVYNWTNRLRVTHNLSMLPRKLMFQTKKKKGLGVLVRKHQEKKSV